jgi:peptide/nickel transport system substrate-binding protein
MIERKRRRHTARQSLGWCAAAIAVATAVGAAGCSSNNSGGGNGTPGNFVRVGTLDSVQSFDYWTTNDTLLDDTAAMIYPLLVQYNLHTKSFEPDFATTWRTSSDGRTYTFTTRKHAEWSDGKPLTAADAAWMINTVVRLQNGAAAALASNVVGITHATATSPTSLTVRFSKPESDALANLTHLPILPEHVWGAMAAGKGTALRTAPVLPSGGHPVVSGGPFIFAKYIYNQSMVLLRNPHYYGSPAHVSGIGIEFFSNDDAMVAAVQANQVDAALGNPNIPPTDVHPLKAAGMRIFSPAGIALNDLIINTNPAKTKHRELLNPVVREAFEYAIDRATIDKIAFLGYAQAGSSLVPPATGKWYDPAVKPLPYSLSKANALLNQAGYKMGPNGIRIADGHPMSYTVLLSPDNGPEGVRTGQIMTTDFAKIGVRLNFQPIGDNALNSAIYANHYRNFDMAMWGWDAQIDPNYILDVVTCSQWYNNSDSGYCNKRYDALYREQATTVNQTKRLKIVYQMQEMLFNARPYIILQYLPALEGWNPKWCDVTVSPDGWFNSLSNDPQTSIRLCHAGS